MVLNIIFNSIIITGIIAKIMSTMDRGLSGSKKLNFIHNPQPLSCSHSKLAIQQRYINYSHAMFLLVIWIRVSVWE